MDVKSYRQVCQKNEEENYFLDKFIFRKISIYFTILFIKLRIKPNQATFLSLVASLGSLYFLTLNTTGGLIAAASLIFAYYMLDHVDGELARYYVQKGLQPPSLKGHYFDVLVHRYSSNLMVFFTGVGVYNLYGYESAVLLGFIACIGISSFPNVVAAQVLAGKIACERDIVHQDKNMQNYLAEQEKKSRQIEEVHRGNTAQKIRKIIIESLFFPGHIILLIIILLADAVLGGGFRIGEYGVSLRYIFIAGMAVIYTLKTVVQSVLWMNKLKQIK